VASTSKPRKVTASLIAKEAGVSPATVSLVLNRRGDDLRINRDTQKRVFDAAKKLNYVPNYLARGLSGASTRSVGMIWPLLGGSPTNSTAAYELVRRLSRRGYVAHMTDHLSDGEFTARSMTDLLQRQVDGLILSSGGNVLWHPKVVDGLKQFKNVVVISPRMVQLQHDLILHDRQQALRDAVEHLVKSGRKRIGVLTIGHSNELKIQAIREQMIAMKQPTDDLMVLPPTDAEEDYLPQLHSLLKKIPAGEFRHDAVFCTDDDMAIMLMDALRDQNLRVPDDVAIIGFNDLQLSRYVNPALASVRRLDLQVAELAEQMLFDRLKTPDLSPRIKHVMMQFVWRPSAGGPPAKGYKPYS